MINLNRSQQDMQEEHPIFKNINRNNCNYKINVDIHLDYINLNHFYERDY
jgi:hypothetical protein